MLERSRMAVTAVTAAIMVAVPCAAAGSICIHDEEYRCFRDRDVDLEDGVLVIESEDGCWTVEIDRDHGLYIDGEDIDLGWSQRSLVKRYYRRMEAVHLMVEEIAEAGAEIGVEGARIGLRALAGLARLVLDDYDSDDLEDDIDDDARDIERLAGRLERKAERLEDKIEELDRLHERMTRSIPELRALEGF